MPGDIQLYRYLYCTIYDAKKNAYTKHKHACIIYHIKNLYNKFSTLLAFSHAIEKHNIGRQKNNLSLLLPNTTLTEFKLLWCIDSGVTVGIGVC